MKAFLAAVAAGIMLLMPIFAQDQTDPMFPERSYGHTMRPVIRGTVYAVSSRKPQATQVAERVLRAGGNAFDAAVAAQAVLGVTDPAMNGIGSDACILIYDARSKQVISINAEGTAPKLATIEWYSKNAGGKIPANDTLLSASLPGIVDAWYLLLDRWGTYTFAQALAPAIEMAENGFPLSESLASTINASRKLRNYPTSMKVYFPGGQAPKPGEIFRNPDLARTLKKLVEAEKEAAGAQTGAGLSGRHAALKAARDRFYRGGIARAVDRFMQENGGLYRYQDFAEYTAKIETPVSVNYRGYDVYKNPSATQGPVELIALNLLEGYGLRALGHNSADYIHTGVEAVKLAYADREKYLGDMDFIKIPFAGLLSKEYARQRRPLIDPHKASEELRPGQPGKSMSGFPPVDRAVTPNLEGAADHNGDTSYLCLVDKDRNVVSFTPSLHSAFGTGVVIGDLGFILNCRGDYYELDPNHANALMPGKRPRSTLTPTLVMKDGKPFMAVGSPGGDDQPMRILQTFLNVVDFRMNIQAAIEAPRWSTSSFPASSFPHTMHPGRMAVEDRIPMPVVQELEKRGHKVVVMGPWSMNATSAIVIDPTTGVLSAGADPRGDNYALAW
jgi:gamma-glutamyltranspeptidase/glutathione hydrolase